MVKEYKAWRREQFDANGHRYMPDILKILKMRSGEGHFFFSDHWSRLVASKRSQAQPRIRCASPWSRQKDSGHWQGCPNDHCSYRAITGSSEDHRETDTLSITGHCHWRQSDRWRQEDRCEFHAPDQQAQDKETVSGLVLMLERPERQKKIKYSVILFINAQLFHL